MKLAEKFTGIFACSVLTMAFLLHMSYNSDAAGWIFLIRILSQATDSGVMCLELIVDTSGSVNVSLFQRVSVSH